MTIAAVVPAIQAVGSLATLASSVVSALSGTSDAASPGAAGSTNGMALNQMERVLQRQEAMQLKAMEMQTEASIQKMMTDTANSIASGHLDSGAKVQNASIKAAQGIHF
ncbi:MAG: hypothetical protein KGQ57_04925 [Burkholderiales bacterium]|nr:hypothetical protein [Burkholderiales bacterium]TAM52764.1 MAG: hypothetical protein EPN57_11715 [Paraburkholderia sp.]